MPSDENTSQSEAARKHLLEEIRRRAEEAEMKRLEDEDRNRAGRDLQTRLNQSQPAPFPVAAAETPAASNLAAVEQKALVIRERLVSALERGKAGKAAELLTELTRLIPDGGEIPSFRARLLVVQQEAARSKELARAPELTGAAAEKAERESRRKKISDMLDAGNTYYQQEKYDKAIQYINEVLNLDPANEEGVHLRAAIERARQLDNQIHEEDEKRREMERTPDGGRGAEQAQPQAGGRSTDFWGASLKDPRLDSDYDLLPEEKGPVGPPPVPLSERIAKQLSGVEWPVKPIIAVAVVAILGLAAWYMYDTIRNTVSPPLYSVLVLPAGTGGDSSLSYIADGFAEELIAGMERVPEMRVIAPATAFAFGASSADPARVARALGANFVLSWSLARAGDRIGVQLAFIDTLTRKSLWSKKAQIQPRELAALQEDILRSLATAMDVKLTTADGLPLSRVVTDNEAAYEMYLRGRSLLRRGDRFAPEEAIALFDEALVLDSTFSEAYAASAWAHALAYETSPTMSASHLSLALASVQKGLTNGLRISEIFRAWGLVEQFRGQFDKAIERFEQAVAIAPSDAEAQRRLALVLAVRGRLEGAVKAAQRSVADDPGNIVAHTILGQLFQYRALHSADDREDNRSALRAYEQGLRLARDKSEYASGSYAEVLVHLQQSERALALLLDRVARERESYLDYYRLGRIQQSAGKPIAEWQSSFVRAREILAGRLAGEPGDAVAEAYLALVHTRLGGFKDATAAMNRAVQLAPKDIDVLYLAARMYALQKDKARARDALSRALTRRFSLPGVLDLDFFNLYSEPDFLALLTR